jgi:NADPH2:quinone reductase
MKAIRVHEFGPPDVMHLEETPKPKAGPGEVVIRVRAAGVNPVDVYVRSGAYARKPNLPYTPGTDAGGVVESVGVGVELRPGTRVYTSSSLSGVYAEKALCQENDVHEMPENVSFSQGAAIGVPYSTAFRALFQRAHAIPGETVLVHGGSGGVGIATIQLAHTAGMRVFATAGSLEGLDVMLQEGAHAALDHNTPDYMDQVMKLTGGRGVDVILEMLANKNLGKDLKVLAPSGRVVVIGSRGSVEIDARDTMLHDAAILGMLLFNASERDLQSIHSGLYAGLEDGTLRPVISKEMPLAEAAQAHKEIMEPGARGKIVLIP